MEKTLLSRLDILKQRFELIKVLGEGAVGAVYKVRDRNRNNMIVALKVLTNDIQFDLHTITRFREEHRISSSLKHPNIVQAYDLIEADGVIAYTMEHVEGADLCSLFLKNKIEKAAIIKITNEVLSALEVLHSYGIWHRDLKLENILISTEGHVKITDLGLIKNVFKKALTRTGVLLGTAQYMPPEYVKKTDYDARSDLYALGIIIYELLKGERRFSASMNGNEILKRLLQTNFAVPLHDLDQSDQRILKFLKRAVAVDPGLRFQSARDMREALLELNKPEPAVVVPPMTELYKHVKKPKAQIPGRIAFQKKIVVGLSSALSVLLIATAGVFYSSNLTKLPFSVLDSGTYQGKIYIFENKSDPREFNLKVKSSAIYWESDTTFCKKANVESDGKLKCSDKNFQIFMDRADAGQYSASLKDLDSGHIHRLSFSKLK